MSEKKLFTHLIKNVKTFSRNVAAFVKGVTKNGELHGEAWKQGLICFQMGSYDKKKNDVRHSFFKESERKFIVSELEKKTFQTSKQLLIQVLFPFFEKRTNHCVQLKRFFYLANYKYNNRRITMKHVLKKKMNWIHQKFRIVKNKTYTFTKRLCEPNFK